MHKKLIALMSLLLVMLLALGACTPKEAPEQTAEPAAKEETAAEQAKDTGDLDLENASWEELVDAARGTTVTFYGWGGDDVRNRFLQTEVADYLKDNYDITLDVVGMDIDSILAKLAGEKEAGVDAGSIDMIWINGENFYSTKENNLLYGPFTQRLPNMEKYIDLDDPETNYDFWYPIEGYEAPYGKAQIVLINDAARTPETPANAEEFKAFVEKYPGQVTYAALPDFTGSAFVRNIIYDLVGWEQFKDMEPDKEVVREAIQPAIDYLISLNPYLWNEGKTFPASSTEITNMFADGELALDISYGPYSPAVLIEEQVYPETARAFLFDNGTIGNTNYMAIAYNAPNKAGAMVVINAMISAEIQAKQFAAQKTLPVVLYDKLTDEEKQLFDSVDIGEGTLPQDELLSHRLPEMPANIVPIIEEIWLEEVPGK